MTIPRNGSRVESTAPKSDWQAIIAVFLVGVAGAVQVGRIAPVIPAIQQEFQLDLFTIGWIVSLITLASACFGLLAGFWVVQGGLRKSVVIGALVMGVCSVAAALSTSVSMLIGARVIEGFGYLAIVVAAPTLIAREASQKDAPFALALWGTFFTLGLSLAAFAGGAISELIGWHGWFMTTAGLVLLSALAALVSVPKSARSSDADLNLRTTFFKMPPASWLLGGAFLGLTLLTLAILSLLPTFLVQEHGFAPSSAGSVTGGVALASIVGSLCYGFLASRLPEIVIALAASIALTAATFPVFATTASLHQIIPFAAVAIFMSGILVAQTFSTVPKVAGSPKLIGPSNGLIAQLGSVGALAGPPMVGALISVADWNAIPILVAGFTMSFAILFTLALKSHNASLRMT
ncbi:MFS transporter [Thalassobius sp. I31.1]|uniref:MFS transporter n=1 Tax=Thalassobius sp. I31.1 TaxID=2109912 RepID=UPI000D19FD21|nr:MFS transporter [Thalassobius sp. I31.1]